MKFEFSKNVSIQTSAIYIKQALLHIFWGDSNIKVILILKYFKFKL